MLGRVNDPAELAKVRRQLLRRAIFDALCLILLGALLACVIGADGMTWEYYAGLAQFGSLLLLLSIMRVINIALIYKRSLRRTYQWMYVVQKLDLVTHCISAVLTFTLYDEWKFMNEMMRPENVSIFAIPLAWIFFVYLVAITVYGSINILIMLIQIIFCKFEYRRHFFCCLKLRPRREVR